MAPDPSSNVPVKFIVMCPRTLFQPEKGWACCWFVRAVLQADISASYMVWVLKAWVIGTNCLWPVPARAELLWNCWWVLRTPRPLPPWSVEQLSDLPMFRKPAVQWLVVLQVSGSFNSSYYVPNSTEVFQYFKNQDHWICVNLVISHAKNT